MDRRPCGTQTSAFSRSSWTESPKPISTSTRTPGPQVTSPCCMFSRNEACSVAHTLEDADAEKRGGAWMDEVCGQSKLFAADGEDLRLPVAHMVCNQTPPIGEQPSLMTFRCAPIVWGCSARAHEEGPNAGGLGLIVAVSQGGGDPLPRVRTRAAAHADSAVRGARSRHQVTPCRAQRGSSHCDLRGAFGTATALLSSSLGLWVETLFTRLPFCRGVEWDAVELPSQFMENWCAPLLPVLQSTCRLFRRRWRGAPRFECRCYHRPTLDSFARHFETGEALPEDLYQKLVAAKNFRCVTWHAAAGVWWGAGSQRQTSD